MCHLTQSHFIPSEIPCVLLHLLWSLGHSPSLAHITTLINASKLKDFRFCFLYLSKKVLRNNSAAQLLTTTDKEVGYKQCSN